MTEAEKAVLQAVTYRLNDLFYDVNYPISKAGAVPVEKIQRELIDLQQKLMELWNRP